MMENEHNERWNDRRGSATVEAVIGLTVFLFTIFTILGMANFCRAQMLISSAVDTAAKEMSQHSYFYQMSGLQKFEERLDDNGNIGKNNINQVIGTVDQLYSSINGAVDQTSQDQANVQNMLNAGNVQLDAFEGAIEDMADNAADNAENIMQGINGVAGAMKDIGNDPLLYMRSLVALIGSEGLETAKRAVAVPLAKAFVTKHFGKDATEANETLKSLGLEEGLDSMNFNMSNIFSDDAHQDIELVVFYKVKLLQVFDWVVLEAKVSKVAHCRAWLGGDDVIVKATKEDGTPLNTEPQKVPEAEGDTEEGKDDPEQETPEGPETPQEPEKPETPPVDLTGSYWTLGDGGYGVENAGVENAFMKLFKETYNTGDSPFGDQISYAPLVDDDGKATDRAVCWDCDPTPDPDRYDAGFILAQANTALRQKEDGYLPAETDSLTYVLYVPENYPDDQYDKLKEAIAEAQKDVAMMQMMAEPGDELYSIGVNVQIVRAGGNHDYGSEGQG